MPRFGSAMGPVPHASGRGEPADRGASGDARAEAHAESDSGPVRAAARAAGGSGKEGGSVEFVDAASGSTTGPIELVQEAVGGSGERGGQARRPTGGRGAAVAAPRRAGVRCSRCAVPSTCFYDGKTLC